MKQLLLYPALLIASHAFAQEADSAASATAKSTDRFRSNELGIVMENTVNRSFYTYQNAIGIQYKKWRSEYLAFRLSALYMQMSTESPIYNIQLNADTFTEHRNVQRMDMAVIGAGIEAQRQFYKKLYLYASADLRLGAGKGSNDTQIVKRYEVLQGNAISYGESVTNRFRNENDLTGIYIGVVPAIGAKLQFKKACFGLEFASHLMTFTSMTSPAQSLGQFDFSLNRISQRIYIGFKF